MTKQQLEKVIAGQKRKLHRLSKLCSKWESLSARLANECLMLRKRQIDWPERP